MTSRRRDGARPPKPGLAAPDADLWDEVTARIEPLKRRRPRRQIPPQQARDADPEAPPVSEPVEAAGQRRRPDVRRPDAAGQAAKPAELTGIDRRMRQKLARGQVEVDARLDLHGTGRPAARAALHAFLVSASARGHRLVLVITGKGEAPTRHTLHGTDHFHTPERRGILRQALTEWLTEPDFASLVSGFQPAHPRHGGGGAFYVRLRRPRR